MKQSRMIGSYVEYLVKQKGLSNAKFAEYIGCDEYQLERFFKGRVFPSFSQISKMAKLCDISVYDILKGDEEVYKNILSDTFDNPANKEKILDIIYDYIDVIEAIN